PPAPGGGRQYGAAGYLCALGGGDPPEGHGGGTGGAAVLLERGAGPAGGRPAPRPGAGVLRRGIRRHPPGGGGPGPGPAAPGAARPADRPAAAGVRAGAGDGGGDERRAGISPAEAVGDRPGQGRRPPERPP